MWPFARPVRRSSVAERADDPTVSDADLARLLHFFDTLNRWTWGRHITLSFLANASHRWTGVVSILDMSCGRGDLARDIVLWARGRGREVRVHGTDTRERAVAMARARNEGIRELTFETRSADDPFFLRAQTFDYVVSEMGLHRRDDDGAALLLKTANRLAKRGFIAVDWLRDVRPRFVLETLASCQASAAVTHDARLAIERGFFHEEAEGLRKAAGLDEARVLRHLGYRFSIEAERARVTDAALVPGLAGLAGA